ALSVLAFVGDARAIAPRALLYQSLAPLAALIAVAAWLRRALLGTAFNRRMVAGGAAIIGGITVSRALGVLAGVSAPQMLLHDCLLAAAVLALCTAFLFRWLAWSVLFMLAAAAAAAVSPAHAMAAFSLASGAALIVSAGFAWRTGVRLQS